MHMNKIAFELNQRGPTWQPRQFLQHTEITQHIINCNFTEDLNKLAFDSQNRFDKHGSPIGYKYIKQLDYIQHCSIQTHAYYIMITFNTGHKFPAIYLIYI